MIGAQPKDGEALARRLVEKAATLARAKIEARRDAGRWREARLLWPQFTKASTRGG